MQGINRIQHEHLKSQLIKLEENLKVEEGGAMDGNDMEVLNELENIRTKRLQLQALHVEYLKKLADIEVHIAHYKAFYNNVSINFVSNRIRKLNKVEREK